MLHIALSGGIGSGKSTAAKILTDLGAVLVDADVLAREVVEPGTRALARIAETFGPRVITATGCLDRPALAKIVFDDREAREQLNSIVHPAVRDAAARVREHAWAKDPQAILIEDIPLLAESGTAARFHGVLIVTTPLETRLDRLEQRGLSREDANARIAAQASEAQRLAIADMVAANDGDLTQLRRRLHALWEGRLQPYRDALVRGARGTGPVQEAPEGHEERTVERLRAATSSLAAEIIPAGPRRVELHGENLPGALDGILRGAGFVPDPAAGTNAFVSADPAPPVTLQIA